jgi:hypothetical protein
MRLQSVVQCAQSVRCDGIWQQQFVSMSRQALRGWKCGRKRAQARP